jgi:HEAT repeat protein
MDPFKIIRAAIRAVPPVKYALGVAGIVAVVAIIQALRLDFKVAVFGTVIIFPLMVVLVIFAKLTTSARRHFVAPVLVMMWASLILVVASAFLLFSAVFFARPQGFHDWLFGSKTQSVNLQQSAARFVKAAEMQRAEGDYEGAWKQIEEVLKIVPDSKEALGLQVRIAMEWLRNMHILKRTGNETFAEIVDRISPCLYRTASGTSGVLAADIHAHLGWGNFLKFKEGVRGLDIENQYKQALKYDPENPYAHAMWGHWILSRHGNMEEARQHFFAALQSGRDRPFVRQFQIAALLVPGELDWNLETIRVVNEMRKNGEDLDSDTRARIKSYVYDPFRQEVIDGLRSTLSPSDHLATYTWLAQGSEVNIFNLFWVARLTEEMGDFSKAISVYRSIQSDPDFKLFSMPKEVEEGIRRCQQKTSQPKSEVQSLLDAVNDKNASVRENAIRSLPRGGGEAKDILPTIAAAIRDENRDVRAAAGEALVELRAAAVPTLIELLASNEERDIQNAAAALNRIGVEAKAAVPALIKVMQNQNEKVRSKVMGALGSMGPNAAAAVPALVGVLRRDEEVDAQEAAAYALGEIGPNAKDAIPLLTKMVKDRKGQPGFEGCIAAEALGKIGPRAKKAVPTLVEALDAYDEVRLPEYAAEALGRIGAEAKIAIPALIQAMKDVEKEHKMNRAEPLSIIAAALREKGDVEAIPLLRDMLRAFEEENFEPKVIGPVREALEFLKDKQSKK